MSHVQREWLLRCQGGVCVIGVSEGMVEIAGPGDEVCFTLDHSEAGDFRAALDDAITRAEHDLKKA